MTEVADDDHGHDEDEVDPDAGHDL